MFFPRNKITLRILATAKVVRFVYPNFIETLFSEISRQNASPKISQLINFDILTLIALEELEGEAKKNFTYLMGVICRKTSRNPRKIRKGMKLCRINPVFEKLIDKFFEMHKYYLLELEDWKKRVKYSHSQIERMFKSWIDERLLVKKLENGKVEYYTKVQFCEICGARFGEFCFYIPHIKRFVCEKCEKKIRSQNRLARYYSALPVKVIKDEGQAQQI